MYIEKKNIEWINIKEIFQEQVVEIVLSLLADGFLTINRVSKYLKILSHPQIESKW